MNRNQLKHMTNNTVARIKGMLDAVFFNTKDAINSWPDNLPECSFIGMELDRGDDGTFLSIEWNCKDACVWVHVYDQYDNQPVTDPVHYLVSETPHDAQEIKRYYGNAMPVEVQDVLHKYEWDEFVEYF